MESIKVFSSKLVKTRKKHQCYKCWEYKDKGTNMFFFKINYDGRVMNIYQCTDECKYSPQK